MYHRPPVARRSSLPSGASRHEGAKRRMNDSAEDEEPRPSSFTPSPVPLSSFGTSPVVGLSRLSTSAHLTADDASLPALLAADYRAGLRGHLRHQTFATNVHVLDLSGVEMGLAQWRWLCHDVLPTMASVTTLRLQRMGLTDRQLMEFMRGCCVGRTNQSLGDGIAARRATAPAVLHSPPNKSSPGNERQTLRHLRILDLGGNHLTHHSATPLGNLLLWAADTLEELRLAGNPLQDYGFQVLGIYLAKLHVSSLGREPHLFPVILVRQHAEFLQRGREARRESRLRRAMTRGSSLAFVVRPHGGGNNGDIHSKQYNNRNTHHNNNSNSNSCAHGGTTATSESNGSNMEEMRELHLGISLLDLRDCHSSARGISELLAGASRAHRLESVLLARNSSIPASLISPKPSTDGTTTPTGATHTTRDGEEESYTEGGRASLVIGDSCRFSSFKELHHPAALSLVNLCGVPLSKLCSPVGCRELFLNLFFCCPKLQLLDISESFDREQVPSTLLLQLVLESQQLAADSRARWRLRREMESAVEFTLEEVRIGRQACVGSVLCELIAHAAFNAHWRRQVPPPAFCQLRELHLNGAGMSDRAAVGLAVAVRTVAVTGVLSSLLILNVADNFLTLEGCTFLLRAFVLEWPAPPSVLSALAMQGNAGIDGTGHTALEALHRFAESAVQRRREEQFSFMQQPLPRGAAPLQLSVQFGFTGETTFCVSSNATAEGEEGYNNGDDDNDDQSAARLKGMAKRGKMGDDESKNEEEIEEYFPTFRVDPRAGTAPFTHSNFPTSSFVEVPASTSFGATNAYSAPHRRILADLSPIAAAETPACLFTSTTLMTPSSFLQGPLFQQSQSSAQKERETEPEKPKRVRSVGSIVSPVPDVVSGYGTGNSLVEANAPGSSSVPQSGVYVPTYTPTHSVGTTPSLGAPIASYPPTTVVPLVDMAGADDMWAMTLAEVRARSRSQGADSTTTNSIKAVTTLTGEHASVGGRGTTSSPHTETSQPTASSMAFTFGRLFASMEDKDTSITPLKGKLRENKSLVSTILDTTVTRSANAPLNLYNSSDRMENGDHLLATTPEMPSVHEEAEGIAGEWKKDAGKDEEVVVVIKQGGGYNAGGFFGLTGHGASSRKAGGNGPTPAVSLISDGDVLTSLDVGTTNETSSGKQRLRQPLSSCLAGLESHDVLLESSLGPFADAHAPNPSETHVTTHTTPGDANLNCASGMSDLQHSPIGGTSLRRRRVKSFVMTYHHPVGHLLCRGWRLLYRRDTLGADARDRFEQDVQALVQPPIELQQQGAVVSSVTVVMSPPPRLPTDDGGSSGATRMQFASNERRTVLAERLQKNANVRDERTAFPRFAEALSKASTDGDTVELVDSLLRSAAASGALPKVHSGTAAATLVHERHDDEEALIDELREAAAAVPLTATTAPTTVTEEEEEIDNNDNDSGLMKDTESEKEESREEEVVERGLEKFHGRLQEERESEVAKVDNEKLSKNDNQFEVVVANDSLECLGIVSEEDKQEKETEKTELNEGRGMHSNTALPEVSHRSIVASANSPSHEMTPNEITSSNEPPLNDAALVSSPLTRPSWRVKSFIFALPHREGHILCRAWQLLHSNDDVGKEARMHLEGDLFHILFPSTVLDGVNQTPATTSESVRFEWASGSATMRLHVTTGDRRATVSDRLQRGTTDDDSFPRLSALLSASPAYDTVRWVGEILQLQAAREAGLPERIARRYRSVAAFVHYYHTDGAALRRELGPVAALHLEKSTNGGKVDGKGDTIDNGIEKSPLRPQSQEQQPKVEHQNHQKEPQEQQERRGRNQKEEQQEGVLRAYSERDVKPVSPTRMEIHEPDQGEEPRQLTHTQRQVEDQEDEGIETQREERVQLMEERRRNRESLSSFPASDLVDSRPPTPPSAGSPPRNVQKTLPSHTATTEPPPAGHSDQATHPQRPSFSTSDDVLEERMRSLQYLAYNAVANGSIMLDVQQRHKKRICKGKCGRQHVTVAVEWDVFLVVYFVRNSTFSSGRKFLVLVHPVAIGTHCTVAQDNPRDVVITITRSCGPDALGVSSAEMEQKLQEQLASSTRTSTTRRATAAATTPFTPLSSPGNRTIGDLSSVSGGSNISFATGDSSLTTLPNALQLISPTVTVRLTLSSSKRADETAAALTAVGLRAMTMIQRTISERKERQQAAKRRHPLPKTPLT